MNSQEFELLRLMRKSGEKNQRYLSKSLRISLGKVNQLLRCLVGEGILTPDFQFSDKAFKRLEENRPERGIILAAGYGMRMIPINQEVPKGLLRIKEETLIERLIVQLKEVGVEKIDVVVGFLKEKYEYLIDKWGVNLIYNGDYAKKNNLHSLLKGLNHIENTYILPCDIWCQENPFSKEEWGSWYMMSEETAKHSCRVNRKGELVQCKKEELGNRMIGISFFRKEDVRKLKGMIQDFGERKEYQDCFWEIVLFQKQKSWIAPRVMREDSVFEINTFEQLREIEKDSNYLRPEILQEIQEVLSCKLEDIVDLRALKKGMTNRSFQFSCRNKKYIARIPGEGTEKLIDRGQEYEVYQRIGGENIAEMVLYISASTGHKISEYIEGTKTCNPKNKEEVKRCIALLKAFHQKHLQVKHEFDPFYQILYYEQLRGEIPSDYPDYEETKQEVFALKRFLDKQEKQYSLSHIDAISDNFLLTDNQVYLIDWEYAGMQDVHIDLAMFGIYALYSKEEMDWLLELYFEGKVDAKIRVKIYCYISVCGLLWSNWCEYKKSLGIEFGEYSLRQYRYAKEYYRYAKKEMIHLKE